MTRHSGLSGSRIFTATLLSTLLILSDSGLATTGQNPGQSSGQVKPPGFTLKPYNATYKASIKGVPLGGTGTRSLTRNTDGTWTLAFSADATFFGMEETSHFTSKDGQLISNRYIHQRSGLGKKPAKYASFDWLKNKINWQQGDKEWSMDLKPATLDNLNYQLKLRMDLAAARGKRLGYDVADDNGVYQRTFIIEGEETLPTALGNLETVRLKLQRDNDQRATWIWFAKNYDYFLVRLLQKERNSTYTIDIQEACIDGKKIN